MICGGGFPESRECYTYKDNQWILSMPLSEPKRSFAISKSPFLKEGYQLVISGGCSNTSGVSTIEVLTEEGWKTTLSHSPASADHCMAQLNSTTLVVTNTDKTYFLSSPNQEWQLGPKLIYARTGQSCARILQNGSSQEFSVIVACGFHGIDNNKSPVEILDSGANSWRLGPYLLRVSVFGNFDFVIVIVSLS